MPLYKEFLSWIGNSLEKSLISYVFKRSKSVSMFFFPWFIFVICRTFLCYLLDFSELFVAFFFVICGIFLCYLLDFSELFVHFVFRIFVIFWLICWFYRHCFRALLLLNQCMVTEIVWILKGWLQGIDLLLKIE